MSLSERTPLLSNTDRDDWDPEDPHRQFCMLVGVPPSMLPPGSKPFRAGSKSLYSRATRDRRHQNTTYILTASLSNILLLTQVILGATLTALGASESSHILITVFGVLNTVIAGLVAYLKSRGQPMRARMYRDDLERVVDEIENSEIMWLGISKGVQGYNEITDDGNVSVRSEVARLTRLYERAVRTNTQNNPDMYMALGGFDGATLKAKQPPQSQIPVNVVPQAVQAATASDPAAATTPAPAPAGAPAAAVAVPVPDPDESPATAAKPKAPAPKPEEAVVAKDTTKEAPGKSSNEESKAVNAREGDSSKDVKRDSPSDDECATPPASTLANASQGSKSNGKGEAGSDHLN